jgi:hypothetical protein
MIICHKQFPRNEITNETRYIRVESSWNFREVELSERRSGSANCDATSFNFCIQEVMGFELETVLQN